MKNTASWIGVAFVLILLGLLLSFYRTIERWWDVDACLDAGGRFNYEQGECEFNETETSSMSENTESSSSSVSQEEIISHISILLPEREHNYFVILSTMKDKDQANVMAKNIGGAWVLETDATTNLVPGSYVVVFGPFTDHANATSYAEHLWPPTAAKTPGRYVKDAGALKRPENVPPAMNALPTTLVVAISGRISTEDFYKSTIEAREYTLDTVGPCSNGALHFVYLKKGNEFLREKRTSEQIQEIMNFYGPDAMSSWKDVSSVFFRIDPRGMIIGPYLCFD